jgi:uncharacterized damage-inducible protein DinB
MKRSSLLRQTLIALFALTMLNLSAAAQTTGSAPAKSTLTDEERKVAVAYLEDTRKKFLDSLQGLSEAQWKFKSAPDRWSVAEVAEHIALSEELILGLITGQILKSPAAPEKKESVKGKEEMLRKTLPNRSQKVQAPEVLKPTNRWATQAELVKAFQASRDNTIKYVQTTQDDLRSHFGPHPVFKDLDAYQWLFLLSGHSERHTEQIKEVKADPNFPKK